MALGLEVIEQRLLQLVETVKELRDYQREMNGRVAVHEKWINQRDNQIDVAADRLAMMELEVNEHAEYIAQRRITLQEFETAKKTISEHSAYIEQQRGSRMGVADLISRIAVLVGMAATVYGIYVKH